MVKRCVAAGCSNTYSDNVSLFKFPKDPVLRQKWIKNVQRTRAQWSGPSEYSVLCSEHFDGSCFEPDSELASQMGMQKRRRLKDDAIPTLFERPGPQMSHLSDAGPSGTPSRKRASGRSYLADAGTSKKMRTAYEKRQRCWIVSQLLSDATPVRDSDTEAYQEDGDRPSSSFQCDAEIQVTPDRKNARVQTSTKMKTIGTQVKPGVCSVGVQCSESQIHTHVQDVGVQCSLMAPVRHSTSVFLPSTSSPLPSDASQSESEMSQGDFEIPDLDTSAYTMQDDSSSHDSSAPSVILSDTRSCYIVFESALLILFTVCRFCASKSVDIKKVVTGSFLRITQKCLRCRQNWIWESQPTIGNVPAGNIYTSAAILYAGALPAQALRIFRILNCHTISSNTFFRHQKQYLQPAISTTWKSQQLALLSTLKAQKLVLSGDGRADSPGHSAKYGSYTVIEMSYNKVLDYRLVQSNEVGGSHQMEKEGLQRVLLFLKQQKLTVDVLVTDRHKQINKWLRESYPAITHYYDVWHVAKGFRKKVDAAAKQKGCEIIGNWRRSIINHLYWCVSSTPDGDAETVLAKWLSLEDHVHNKHRHKDKKFPKCAHGKLRGADRNKKWFQRHSKASEKLSDLLTNSYICKDITRLSPKHQTSSLEAFHSVIIHFAPKYVPLSFHGMNCRLALAALHFNENASRKQAVTAKGQECYDILYPKYKKGGHIVRKVTVNPTYRYVDDLVKETLRRCKERVIETLPSNTPGPLSSQYERPDKPTAIKSHKSRFV